MANYYNENDLFTAQWLHNLIAAGMIPGGWVDTRSIEDVTNNDLQGFSQWHFFAGIGGWCEALRLSGLSKASGICTGSPPCQENSIAAAIHGKRTGLRGVRSGLAHRWLDLVEALRPRLVLFENVPGIQKWQAEITGRLEGFGYRTSVQNLSAASVGAPHLRRRVWITADRDGQRLPVAGAQGPPKNNSQSWAAPPRGVWREDHTGAGRLADGVPKRMASIRAFGNSIVPQVAAQIIQDLLREPNQ